MARLSLINREAKRRRLVNKYAAKRKALKETLLNPQLSTEERAAARRQFHSMPRDACATRLHNRCRITGRPRGYYRKFGLGRNKLREAAMRGDIPGLVKSSW